MHVMTLAWVDGLCELVAAIGFLALGLVVLYGLITTHHSGLRENPLAYSCIAIFWASTAHRVYDAWLSFHGERVGDVVRLMTDVLVFSGLAGYWIVRFAVRREIGDRVLLFRDRAAEEKDRRMIAMISASTERDRTRAQLLVEQAVKLLTPLRAFREYAMQAEGASPVELTQLVERTGAIEDVVAALVGPGKANT